ncbi:chemotaxis protein [Rhizobium sp. KAs_5_22]|uniref:chemotaxis protein MotC n=1 Tax=Ciceribacter selenitireducens TaxID=448181 RepID=UPI00048AC998|nr:chemotaxis protein MotC [Ciceribacter selenitireducens]PPJ47796.1 chemotaxis protein [Rhizobium sp. KAs_5_22]
MGRMRLHLLVPALSLLGLAWTAAARAEDMNGIEPYKMLRSLQFVQDSVVLGDHSAAEMQRFMLETIDKRLREADSAIFEEPRNIDATLIYAMSGGNPATLEFLVARDIDGNFDNRVTDALRKYLSGKGTLIAKTLGDMVTEYRDTKIAPYLALIAGNVMIPRDPVAALKFYDWARLTAPGTIVEEAALRRSLAVAVEGGMVDKAGAYANRYARRFLHSPYASQFADLFVQLVVEHTEAFDQAAIEGTLVYMDTDRQREVYLRIARQAAIKGRNELARQAADKAKLLSGTAEGADALAKLYGGLAGIPTNEVGAAIAAIAAIPDEILSPSDRALRDAAAAIAEEVVRKPEANSQAQAPEPSVAIQNDASVADGSSPAAPASDEQQDPTAPASDPQNASPQTAESDAEGSKDQDPEFRSFVDTGRSKLDAIDDLLKQEGTN